MGDTKRGLNRSISCTDWRAFRSMLAYRAHRDGRTLAVIDRFYPSSRTCSTCGYLLASLALSTRAWTCPSCGTRHDRDINAAKNILAAALAACGDGVSRQGISLPRSSVKQETLGGDPGPPLP